jgi:hypothetical protein
VPLPDLARPEWDVLLKLVENASTYGDDRLPLNAFDKAALRELRIKLRQSEGPPR